MADEGLVLPVFTAGSRGPQKSGVLVVAIDFGTTYSGFAYSFSSEYQKDPLQVYAQNFFNPSNNSQWAKVPTTVLFQPDKTFHSFGLEAEDEYARLCKENHSEAKKWYYFERFKMSLHNNTTLFRDMQLIDFTHKKSMQAIVVFAAAIRCLREHLVKTLISRHISVDESEISWVLTIPAIWNDQARQFMREAATMAGIDNSQLQLALEPEAASVFCQKFFQSQNMTADSVDLTSPGVRFMVADCGGGTIDVTVYEIQEEGILRELYRPSGGDWGGTKVDENFKQFLYDLLDFDTVTKFERLEMLELYREFELLKRMPVILDKVPLKLPPSIKDAIASKHGDFNKYKGEVSLVHSRLMINRSLMEGFFQVPCQEIVKHLKSVLDLDAVKGVKPILIVGGFSESTLLQEAVRKEFPSHQVLVPNNPAASILKGAVIYCHRPSVIGWRASAYTYGIRINRDFQESDPIEKQHIIDGVKKCKDVFDKFITINEVVKANHEFPSRMYHPLYSDQTEVKFEIFISPKPDPQFTTDPGCRQIGKVIVLTPDLSGGKSRQIPVSMVVGGVELRLIARDENTQKEFTTTVDFLYHE